MNHQNKHSITRLGARIKALRKEKAISQEKLAELINKSVDTVSSIERGVFHPRVGTAMDIASALGVSIADLFSHPAAAEVKEKHVGDPAHSQILHLLHDQPVEILHYMLDHIRQIIRLKETLVKETITKETQIIRELLDTKLATEED